MKPTPPLTGIVTGALLALLILPAIALGSYPDSGESDNADREARMLERINARFDRMDMMLDLSVEQRAKLERMKTSIRQQIQIKKECKRQLKQAFDNELAKETVNFNDAAHSLKSDLSRRITEVFEESVDATAAFYACLTPQQRAKLVRIMEMKRDRKGARRPRQGGPRSHDRKGEVR